MRASPSEPSPSPGPLEPAHRGEDLNARLLGSLLRYTEEQYGRETARRILEHTGLSVSDLSGSRYWISHAEFEAVLASCRALFAHDEEFRLACRYRLAEGYGPLRFLVRAASMSGTYVLAVRTMHLVSRISRFELLEVKPGSILTRYTSDRPESRLMCLSRRSNMESMATLWGLPPAVVEETTCIAQGDEACTYHVRWYERPRWLPALAGALLGGTGSAALLATGGSTLAAAILPCLGALGLHLWELRKVYRRNVAFSEDSNERLRELARNNAEALQEIGALTQRHKDWSRLLEAQISDRQRHMEEAMERMGALLTERHTKTAQTTHDMGSPLQLLKTLPFFLGPHIRKNPEAEEALKDAGEATKRIEELCRQLLETPVGPLGACLPLKPTPLEVAPLAERLKRRVLAQVLGKNVRVSAFVSRDAPARIHTDPLLFDRVVDNLLTNAARYTARGSILVELDGTAESLVVKVSDTGAGIAEDELRLVFQPGMTGRVRDENSHGLGLPIVVSLLDQMGGRLEVISRPKVGTTFWAHFPLEPRPPKPRPTRSAPETPEEVVCRVVTFRVAND